MYAGDDCLDVCVYGWMGVWVYGRMYGVIVRLCWCRMDM